MDRYMIDIEDDGVKTVPLGRVGEGNVTEIGFNVASWLAEFPGGTITLLMRRPGADPDDDYTLPLTMDGNTAVYTLNQTDLEFRGSGRIELHCKLGDQDKKSRVWSTKILDALGTSGTVPSPYQPYVDSVIEAADSANEAVEHYPYIDSTSGNWMRWDVENGEWIDTGVHAQGERGEQGIQGVPGERGERGETGATGATGAPGRDGVDGQDGSDGITPTIGTNGNWYLGSTDTGKPSRGEDGTDGADGTDGKSAYQTAVDAGYTGTEAQFAQLLATALSSSDLSTDIEADKDDDSKAATPKAVFNSSEQHWKFIDSIDLEEDVSSYTKTLISYGIYSVMVVVDAPAYTAAGSIRCKYLLENNIGGGVQFASNAITNSIGTTAKTSVFRFVQEGNHRTSERWSSDNTAYANSVCVPGSIYYDSLMHSVVLSLDSGAAIPAGTKISVYGKVKWCSK